MRTYLLAYGLSLLSVCTFSLSVSAQTPERLPPPTPPGRPGQVTEVPLGDQPSPASVAPTRPGSVELEATKVPKPLPLIERRKTEGVVGAAVLLILLLLGNAFQFYRQGLHEKTICNELESAFNSVAWSVARCMNKTRELDERTAPKKADDLALLKEFREFSLDTEFILRTLNEQLVTVARNLRRRDKRWKAGQFGHTPEEVERIRKAVTERPVRES